MSTVQHFGNVSVTSIEIIWCRWGGGATHGRYHVFAIGKALQFITGISSYSEQCVVDDFGTLVRAPSC